MILGILARHTHSDEDDMRRQCYEYINIVVCNLYPFEATVKKPNVVLADAIENIDIGEFFFYFLSFDLMIK